MTDTATAAPAATTRTWGAELPKLPTTEGQSKWGELLRPAAEDRQVRLTTFPPDTSDKVFSAFRRNLAHAANSAGFGVTSIPNKVVTDEDATKYVDEGADPLPIGTRLLFWQVGDKKKGKNATAAAVVEAPAPETPKAKGK